MPSPAAKAEEMKRRYLREAVITASPAARLNMLFDKMVLELELVDGGFERDDYKEINDRLCRVQDILLALRGHCAPILGWRQQPLAALLRSLQGTARGQHEEGSGRRPSVSSGVVRELATAWRQASEQEAACARRSAYDRLPGLRVLQRGLGSANSTPWRPIWPTSARHSSTATPNARPPGSPSHRRTSVRCPRRCEPGPNPSCEPPVPSRARLVDARASVSTRVAPRLPWTPAPRRVVRRKGLTLCHQRPHRLKVVTHFSDKEGAGRECQR